MPPSLYIAFEGSTKIGFGDLTEVALAAREAAQRGLAPVLIFDAATSQPIELDLRGSEAEVAFKLAGQISSEPEPGAGPRGPGRPRLGVVAREVTLLPRHWEWLNGQPGGASVALRKLVEEARKTNASKDRLRLAQESAYRFISAMAGNEPGFEEASRALFAGSSERFRRMTESWPGGVRDHARALADRVFASELPA
jgi:uncharacterized protein